MSPLRYMAALPLALALLTAPAYAAVDFTPVTNHIIEIGAGILTIFGTWALNSLRSWLDAKTGLKNSQLEDDIQQRMNEALLRGIAAAKAKAETELGKTVKQVDLHNFIAEQGAKYVVSHWPDLTKSLTPEKIVAMVRARLVPGPEADAANAITIAKAAAPKP
jgi:hypothetical protein